MWIERIGELAMPKITKIYGINNQQANKLRSVGIETTRDLLIKGRSFHNQQLIARQTGIQLVKIRQWVNQVNMYRVRGVGERYANLLGRSGVNSLNELARFKPQDLHRRLAQRNSALNLVRKLPSQNQVGKWVYQANSLAGDPTTDDEI
jgi:nucleotidyltransferase/DNA polymerase involved in DNA repair